MIEMYVLRKSVEHLREKENCFFSKKKKIRACMTVIFFRIPPKNCLIVWAACGKTHL